MKVVFSAPAKVILSGEHSVVYGKPALVSAFDKRLTFTVEDANEKFSTRIPHIDDMVKIVRQHIRQDGHDVHDRFTIRIDSEIPVGRGMGSSSALSVAGIAAFLTYFTGSAYPDDVVNNLAYKVEKLFHGNPSGVDSTASSFGGLIFFRKEFEFLKGIYKLGFKLPQSFEKALFLIDTGKPEESTAEMVESVGSWYNKDSKVAADVFNSFEKVTKRLIVSIMKEDNEFFKEQIAENQKLLSKIGVVSGQAEKILSDMYDFGVGKITGAGGIKRGSGFLLFFAEDVDGMRKYCADKNLEIFPFKQSHQGIMHVEGGKKL